MSSISVIIPNYNHGPYLKQRIESVIGQSYRDFEVIILDDCSTDNSREVIDQYQNNSLIKHIVYNSTNSGSTFPQWEKGLQLATGDYIWIAESDDYADANFLETAVARLTEDQSDLFYCKTVQVDAENNYLNQLEWWLTDLDKEKWLRNHTVSAASDLQQYLIYKNYITNASSVVFKNKPRSGGYIAAVKPYKYCGDWLFWLQYFKDAHIISYSVDTCNYWRAHLNTTRSLPQSSRKNAELFAIYQWIAKNIFGKENTSLLRYYLRTHITKVSRRYLNKQWELLQQGSAYSKAFPYLFFRYFLFNKI